MTDDRFTTPDAENVTTELTDAFTGTPWRARIDAEKAKRTARKALALLRRATLKALGEDGREAMQKSLFHTPGEKHTRGGRTYVVAQDGSWRRID